MEKTHFLCFVHHVFHAVCIKESNNAQNQFMLNSLVCMITQADPSTQLVELHLLQTVLHNLGLVMENAIREVKRK